MYYIFFALAIVAIVWVAKVIGILDILAVVGVIWFLADLFNKQTKRQGSRF